MIINIDKPVDWTSFDVVKKIRNVTNHKKVGHGGTLDPFATGVLIIGTENSDLDTYIFERLTIEGVLKIGTLERTFLNKVLPETIIINGNVIVNNPNQMLLNFESLIGQPQLNINNFQKLKADVYTQLQSEYHIKLSELYNNIDN